MLPTRRALFRATNFTTNTIKPKVPFSVTTRLAPNLKRKIAEFEALGSPIKSFICAGAAKDTLINTARSIRNADKHDVHGYFLKFGTMPLTEPIRVYRVEFIHGISARQQNEVIDKIWTILRGYKWDNQVNREREELMKSNPEYPRLFETCRMVALWQLPEAHSKMLDQIEEIEGVAYVEEGQVVDGEDA